MAALIEFLHQTREEIWPDQWNQFLQLMADRHTLW